jgi:hypothetical protein
VDLYPDVIEDYDAEKHRNNRTRIGLRLVDLLLGFTCLARYLGPSGSAALPRMVAISADPAPPPPNDGHPDRKGNRRSIPLDTRRLYFRRSTHWTTIAVRWRSSAFWDAREVLAVVLPQHLTSRRKIGFVNLYLHPTDGARIEPLDGHQVLIDDHCRDTGAFELRLGELGVDWVSVGSKGYEGHGSSEA